MRMFLPAKKKVAQGLKRKGYKNGYEGKSSISLLLSLCSLQIQLRGAFNVFFLFLSAVRIFPFCCPQILTNLPCIFSYWFRLEFTFGFISSSLFEPADSEDFARLKENSPRKSQGMHLTIGAHISAVCTAAFVALNRREGRLTRHLILENSS